MSHDFKYKPGECPGGWKLIEPVEEGLIKKGGQNPVPTTKRPPAPQGSSGKHNQSSPDAEG